jgi:hypothetical protein
LRVGTLSSIDPAREAMPLRRWVHQTRLPTENIREEQAFGNPGKR